MLEIKNRLFAFLLLLILLSSSCTKVISVDENYHHSRLVLNSIFDVETDSLEVFVSESRSVSGYDVDYAKVSDAEIYLYENSVALGRLSLSECSELDSHYSLGYGSRYILNGAHLDASANYTIRYVHPTMGICEASSEFPTKVEVSKVSLGVEPVMIYGESSTALVAYVTFTDPAGEDNYYQIMDGYSVEGNIHYEYKFDTVSGYYNMEKTDTIIYSRTNWNTSGYEQIDPLLRPGQNDIFDMSENIFQVFSGELIDGKVYTMKYVINTYSSADFINRIDTANGEFYNIHFNMRTIPRDLYLYYISAESFYWNDGSPFSEPVQVHSNVDNGVGMVAGVRQSSKIENYGTFKEGKVYMTNKEYYK